MRFSRFAHFLSELEATTKRLEITDILAKLLGELELEETDKAVYLSLGQLGPLFAQIDFAIAERMMFRIISLTYNVKESDVKKLYEKEGDLGSVAEALKKERGHKFQNPKITEVYNFLKEIAEANGQGSQEKKVVKFSELLSMLDPQSTRYVVRIPLGNIRLGFSEITIIEALSWMEKKDKSLKAQIESFYHVYPDIGKISKLFKKGGLRALKEGVELEVGVPVLPQLCQRVSTAEEAIEKLQHKAAAEYKYDGTRVQLHLDRSKTVEPEGSEQLSFFENGKKMPFVKTFTRNLEETTHMFPDLVKSAIKQIDAQSAILDGEAVGIDPKTGKMIPFQETSQRKRKYQILEKISEIPLRYFVFDLLFLNGKSLLDKPLGERRRALKRVLKKGETIAVDNQKLIDKSDELLGYFKEAKSRGLEGLVLKRQDSKYEAGGRGYAWVKFKREETGGLEDTVDGVILGYYFGRGARAKFGIGGFLVGVFDGEKEKFLTVCKVGSGPSEKEWQEIKSRVDKIKLSEQPKNVEVTKTLIPDVWARPEIVVVIRADEVTVSEVHTAGFALRFPRLMQFRSDKGPRDTTSPKEIRHLYEMQSKGS